VANKKLDRKRTALATQTGRFLQDMEKGIDEKMVNKKSIHARIRRKN